MLPSDGAACLPNERAQFTDSGRVFGTDRIIWRYRTGSPWRDVSDHFGAWQSVWERHRRWSDDGTYVRIFAAVRAAAPERDEQLRNLLSVDSTIARAHQHSAGARREAHTGGTVE